MPSGPLPLLVATLLLLLCAPASAGARHRSGAKEVLGAASCGSPCPYGNNDCTDRSCPRCDGPGGFNGKCVPGWNCSHSCTVNTDCDQTGQCNQCIGGRCGAGCFNPCSQDSQCLSTGCGRCFDGRCQLSSCGGSCESDADCPYGCLVCRRGRCSLPTLLVHNATIHTSDPQKPLASAMCISKGKFEVVGTYEEAKAACGTSQVLSANGRAIFPGFADAHAHLFGEGFRLLRPDLGGATSVAMAVQTLVNYVKANPLQPGQWLQGRGWDQNKWTPPQFPTRQDLDAAFPDSPVWLQRVDGHAGWANSAALRAVPPLPPTDPEGGEIIRDAQGVPTGVLIDNAMALVERHIPEPSADEMQRALALVLAECARFGLTSVHDMGLSRAQVEQLRRAADWGNLTVRVYGAVTGNAGEDLRPWLPTDQKLNRHGDRLTVSAVKFLLDGALGSWGASLLEPYTDRPDTSGLLLMTPEELMGNISAWAAEDWQVCTHAIGDRANRLVLDAYAKLAPKPNRRLRIEHAQILNITDLDRFVSLGVIPSMQPTHATSDMAFAEQRLGAARLKGAYAWESLLNTGVPTLAFGSDFPVEPVNPLLGTYAAVTRQDTNGMPPGGWLPEEVVPRSVAIRGFTLAAAEASFQEDWIGSIRPGKAADFVILDTDIATCPPNQIWKASVIATFIDGEAVFQATRRHSP